RGVLAGGERRLPALAVGGSAGLAGRRTPAAGGPLPGVADAVRSDRGGLPVLLRHGAGVVGHLPGAAAAGGGDRGRPAGGGPAGGRHPSQASPRARAPSSGGSWSRAGSPWRSGSAQYQVLSRPRLLCSDTTASAFLARSSVDSLSPSSAASAYNSLAGRGPP